MTFTARPTTYKGIQMRSRLEARVAADLDRLWPGSWTYEPRAFANENGQYLPDFRLTFPDGAVGYIEAKPTMDAAYRIMPRMQIIWDSEPDSRLILLIPDGSGFVALLASDALHRDWRLV